MMSIVVTILSTLLKPLTDYLADPIKNRINYLCCYSSNVERLTHEVSELKVRKESVDQDVRAAEEKLEVIRPEVQSWRTKVEEVHTKSNRICNDAEQVQRSCLSKWLPCLHYSLSKEANKTAEVSIQLRNIRFERIANPVNPADLEPVPTSEIGFESRSFIEKQIMDALKNERVHLIGLCGMGGLGKTTMAKKILNWACEKTKDSRSIFEKVIMVIVSRPVDLSKIQQDIAKGLGLDITSKEDSLINHAKILHAKLKATNGVLIILDDVWERLNLEKIGIPSPSTSAGCKLILTSRNRDVVTLREDAKIFSLEVLNNEESWMLFKKNAGNSIDLPHLHQLAKDVVAECKGLPLALEIVGCALRDRNKNSWENALREMQNAKPTNIPNVLTHVYGPLQLSFSQLESEESKYLFLLCCLFPEDYFISLEELVRYGMSLRIFEVENLRQARNKVEHILENLIAQSLLIGSSDMRGNLYVKMHDIIRDMGIWITSEGNSKMMEKHVFMISHGMQEWPNAMEDSDCDCNYTCASLTFTKADFDVSKRINCPKLELLRIYISSQWYHLKIPEEFFSRMRELKVLEVSKIRLLPSSVHMLNKLQTLYLIDCEIEMPSVIGNLMNLEILCLEHCEFEVLPVEIGGLKRLRMLDITSCQSLRRIAFGVLSGLTRLEELVVVRSYENWGAEEKDHASLVELNSLRHLTNLQIQIHDANVIPKETPHWLQKLIKYSIVVSRSQEPLEISESKFQKAIIVEDEVVTPLGCWFDDMTKDAEYLDLGGPNCTIILNMLALSGYQNVKHLRLSKWNDVQYLSCVEGQQNGAIFPILESLHIEESCNLQEISNGRLPEGSFKALEEISLSKMSNLMHLWTFPNERLSLSNLRKVYIDDCASLLYLFPLSIAVSLSQLEELEVSNCPIIKEVFKKEERGIEITINKIEFPKLRKLTLRNLRSLCGLCIEVNEIEVPKLYYLVIVDLPSIVGEGGHDTCQQFLFDQQVSSNSLELRILPQLTNFYGLGELKVESIHNFKSLFSPSALSGFPYLEVLKVANCSMLEEVIGKGENMGETKTKRTLFPRLSRLDLCNLPKLLGFSHSMGDMNLPLLRNLTIEDCPMMETFVQEFSNEPISITGTRPSYSQHIGQYFFSKEVFGLPNLDFVTIKKCASLVYLFPLSIAESWSQLVFLEVSDCPVMKGVFKKDERGMEIIINKIEFPKLWFLSLQNLPSLCGLCIGVDAIEVPELWTLQIFDLMCGLCIGGHDIHQQFLFNKQVSSNRLELPILQLNNFSGLEYLVMRSIHNFKSLFPPSILSGFPNLKQLSVRRCSMLEEVIGKEENMGDTKIKRTPILPRLVEIILLRLPKLLTFSHMNNDLELPSLESVKIDDCPMLERFSLGNLHLPELEYVFGVSDPNQFFFNKERSSHETHLENNCFTISARDLSFIFERSLTWLLTRDSSDSFVSAARVYKLREIKGELEAIKLLAGVVYEIILMIKLPKDVVERSVNFDLTLPGGIIQHHRELLYHTPKSEWIEILVGEFTREPNQIGQLEFSLCLKIAPDKVFIKGFTIRMKV